MERKYTKKVNANAIIRGLRNPADFQDEITLANFNRSIDSNIENIIQLLKS